VPLGSSADQDSEDYAGAGCTVVSCPPTTAPLLGYEDYCIQDLLIQLHNTRYRLARYRTLEGETLIGVLPEDVQGSHFGITLKSHILYQYYHQRVTQPLILQQLTEWGIDISSGQISRILTEDKECFPALKTGGDVGILLSV